MKNINEECEEFCKKLGADNWGEAQLNSMNTAFYAGALSAFNIFSEISSQENEDIAVNQIEEVYQAIKDNLVKENKIMQRIWDEK